MDKRIQAGQKYFYGETIDSDFLDGLDCLDGFTFSACAIIFGDFAGKTLHNVTFLECKLDGWNLTDGDGCDDYGDSDTVKITGDITFRRCDLYNIDFVGSEYGNIFFWSCNLDRIYFINLTLSKLELLHCKINDTYLDGSWIKSLRLYRCAVKWLSARESDISGAMNENKFTYFDGSESSFESVEFALNYFGDCYLKSCNLRQAKFKGSCFADSSDFSDASFFDTDFSCCNFVGHPLWPDEDEMKHCDFFSPAHLEYK